MDGQLSAWWISKSCSWWQFSYGVLQGAALGPSPFNCFLNNMQVNIKSLLAKYAEDTKTDGVVNKDEDKADVQSDLDHLICWGY